MRDKYVSVGEKDSADCLSGILRRRKQGIRPRRYCRTADRADHGIRVNIRTRTMRDEYVAVGEDCCADTSPVIRHCRKKSVRRQPRAITTEAVISGYTEAETAVAQQPKVEAFIAKYTEITEGADKASLTPAGLIAYVATYAETTSGSYEPKDGFNDRRQGNNRVKPQGAKNSRQAFISSASFTAVRNAFNSESVGNKPMALAASRTFAILTANSSASVFVLSILSFIVLALSMYALLTRSPPKFQALRAYRE